MTRKPLPVVQLSADDIETLRWIIRWKQASAVQVARRFGISQPAASKRLTRLVNTTPALVSMHKIVVGWHAFYSVTPAGHGYMQSEFTAAPPRLTTVEHNAACVDVGIDVELACEGAVWSEREVASALYQTMKDHRAGEREAQYRNGGRPVLYALDAAKRMPRDLWTVDSRGVTHSPDMVAQHEDGLTAYEVELTSKTHDRLRTILASFYASLDDDGNCPWAAVIYYCRSEGIAAAVRRAAARLTANYSGRGPVVQALIYKPAHSTPITAKADRATWLASVRKAK